MKHGPDNVKGKGKWSWPWPRGRGRWRLWKLRPAPFCLQTSTSMCQACSQPLPPRIRSATGQPLKSFQPSPCPPWPRPRPQPRPRPGPTAALLRLREAELSRSPPACCLVTPTFHSLRLGSPGRAERSTLPPLPGETGGAKRSSLPSPGPLQSQGQNRVWSGEASEKRTWLMARTQQWDKGLSFAHGEGPSRLLGAVQERMVWCPPRVLWERSG